MAASTTDIVTDQNSSQEAILPVLMEVKWNISEVWVVKEQHLLQVSVANNFLSSCLVYQVNNNLWEGRKKIQFNLMLESQYDLFGIMF